MTDAQTIQTEMSQTLEKMREKLGIRAASLTEAQGKARRLMPRGIYKGVKVLAAAEPFLNHPKLRQTVDIDTLTKATTDLLSYLDGIDLADRRKGWWLGMLGGLSFNLIALSVVLLVVLVWRGYL